MKPHLHAVAIKAWADGEQIECSEPRDGAKWVRCPDPAWSENLLYRVRKFPTTSLSASDMRHAEKDGGFEAIANLAIKQHILDCEKRGAKSSISEGELRNLLTETRNGDPVELARAIADAAVAKYIAGQK